MSEAKVEFEIGNVRFSGTGDQEWLGQQLDKILNRAKEIVKLAPVDKNEIEDHTKNNSNCSDSEIAQKSLPVFLKEKDATKNQVKKFLVTSVWLHEKGKNRLKTRDVSSALKESSQTKLSNPSDCLNSNVSKGYCEKDGTDFFVTQDGRESL